MKTLNELLGEGYPLKEKKKFHRIKYTAIWTEF